MGQLFHSKEIYAIGGGKGGVGKSFISANLGVALAKGDSRVLLIDADLGGANLHTCLGIPAPERTLADFLNGGQSSIESVMVDTPIPNLKLISGGQDVLGIANPKYTQKIKILKAIQGLDVDHVLLDLGAGTSYNTLDFFLIADKGVLVVVPEPTSVENAYRFIKSALYRRLMLLAHNARVKEIIEKATHKKSELGLKSPAELVAYVETMDQETGAALKEAFVQFRPRLILNQVRSLADIRIGFAMKSACIKFFGIEMDFVGYIEQDDQVWRSIRQRQPVTLMGSGKTSRHFDSILHNLVNNQQINPE